MATFNIGDSLTIVCDSDDQLSFTGNASIKVAPNSGSPWEFKTTGVNQPLGPFRGGATLTVSCITAGSYTSSNNTNFDTTVTTVTDPVTGGVRNISAPTGMPGSTLAVLGTSIEGLTSNQLMPTPATITQSWGALVLANAALGLPWTTIDNYGLSGDTSGPSAGGHPGFTSRLPSILSGGYDWCFVGFPINDINNGLDPLSVTIPNMQSIYSQLMAAGIKVIAGLGAPSTQINIAGNQAWRDAYAKVQQAIKSFVANKSGIVLANTALAMTNPATGLPITSPAVTTDGLHDNHEGAGRKAQCLYDTLLPLVKVQDTLSDNIFDPRNYSINPFGQGDNSTGVAGFTAAAGVTGTGPNGWATSVTGTGAAVGSRAPARVSTWKQPNQGARFAVTATATWDSLMIAVGGDNTAARGRYDTTWAALAAYTYGERRKPTVDNGYRYVLITPGTTGASEPTWIASEGAFVTDGSVVWMAQRCPVAGDQFFAEFEVETSGLTAGKGAGLRARCYFMDTTGATKDLVWGNQIDTSNANGPPARWLPPSMKIRTPIVTMSAGWSIRYLKAELHGIGEAGASFNLDVFRASIIRVNS